MAIIITNGTYYVWYTKTGAMKKTTDISQAYQFQSITDAVNGMKNAEGKTKNYYVFDTLTQRIVWKWMTQDEIDAARKKQMSRLIIKRDKSGKIKRKTYSDDTRKLIYLNAGGRCELCGRKILLDDMTIDHINPLSMGGEDDVENLSCTCYPCNLFKGNILPTDFYERITDIFMYQIEKKHSRSLKWKIVHKVLEKML